MTPNLSGLTIGSMALTPTFGAKVYEYTAGTSNAKDKVTTTADASLTVAIELNGVAMDNGDDATWETGDNVLTVTVTNAIGESEDYVVTVTKA